MLELHGSLALAKPTEIKAGKILALVDQTGRKLKVKVLSKVVNGMAGVMPEGSSIMSVGQGPTLETFVGMPVVTKPRKKPFKLCIGNYYSPDRPHVSTSMVNDYLASPEYYHRKHVLKALKRFPATPSMKTGSFVDSMLTNPMQAPNFHVGATKRGEDMPFTMTENDFAKAIEIAEFVKQQPFWQDGLGTAKFQIPLEDKYKGMPVCGLPDRMDLRGNILHIQDIKVTAPSKLTSPQKWWWNCLEMGYVRQAAMYRWLASKTFGLRYEFIKFSHIVLAREEPGLVYAELFNIPDREINRAEAQLVAALDGIVEKRFAPVQKNWVDAYDLAGDLPSAGFEDSEEEFDE